MVFLCLFFSVSLRFLRTWLSVLPVRFSILSCLVFVVHVNFLNPLANKFISLRTMAANSLIKSRGVDCCHLRWYVINGLGLKRMRRMDGQLWLYLTMFNGHFNHRKQLRPWTGGTRNYHMKLIELAAPMKFRSQKNRKLALKLTG